ncbi:MAG: hypothetical protein EAZ70_07650 [Runella slithyformis]|nr:MAG: hypothetical protein EAY79_06995 [Runella slithyformis]TAF27208.1 MAG: hypothetical protein EAZ70_07650 [Runella slithyformis]TAF45856.1 MAG: hypothetical protein EAZ63_10455 [Runella slithyformis]TAF80683.1 MAG: hypothetical protein EAZ50_08270 [Runella slithyformis]
MKKIVVILFLLSQLCSCTFFKEFHYFKDRTPLQPNYYKLEVKGRSVFYSKTRYWSGYFDDQAIKLYFNEFAQPKDGQIFRIDTSGVRSLISGNEDKKLVMLLSSNSDDIAAQINAMAENKKTIESILGIANKDNFTLLSSIKSQKESAQTSIAEKLDEWRPSDFSSLDSASTKRELLRYLNSFASELGNSESFTDWNEAKRWLKNYKSIKNR